MCIDPGGRTLRAQELVFAGEVHHIWVRVTVRVEGPSVVLVSGVVKRCGG
jgi:hypothetical protein